MYIVTTITDTTNSTTAVTIFILGERVLRNYKVFFFLSLNVLIGWQLSICICCRPFSSLLDNYQLLCFWLLALSIVVEVVPRPFFRILLFQGCLLQTRYA